MAPRREGDGRARPRRRGKGEGSVYQRKSDGRWVGAVVVGHDENGKLHRRTVYGETQREALEKLRELQTEGVLHGRIPELSRLTSGEFLRLWLEGAALRPTTREHYASLLRAHILPRIGGVQVAGLTGAHVDALLAGLEREGASGHVRRAVYGLLHRALGRGKGGAVRRRLLRSNPCDEIERPRRPERELRVLDVNEVRKLFETAAGDPLEALYVLAVATGLRQGELLGLRWGDVDLRAGTLTVQRTLRQLAKSLEFGPPKTAAGRRRVDLPTFAVLALDEHRRRLGAIPHTEALVFTDAAGGPIRRSNLLRRSFHPLLERAKLPRIRFHDLRHSSASLLLEQHVHPKVVSERLGHSEVGITLNVYSHVVAGLQREAADKLEAAVGRASHAAGPATRELQGPKS